MINNQKRSFHLIHNLPLWLKIILHIKKKRQDKLARLSKGPYSCAICAHDTCAKAAKSNTRKVTKQQLTMRGFQLCCQQIARQASCHRAPWHTASHGPPCAHIKTASRYGYLKQSFTSARSSKLPSSQQQQLLGRQNYAVGSVRKSHFIALCSAVHHHALKWKCAHLYVRYTTC